MLLSGQVIQVDVWVKAVCFVDQVLFLAREAGRGVDRWMAWVRRLKPLPYGTLVLRVCAAVVVLNLTLCVYAVLVHIFFLPSCPILLMVLFLFLPFTFSSSPDPPSLCL